MLWKWSDAEIEYIQYRFVIISTITNGIDFTQKQFDDRESSQMKN